jgi:hypothetical protein
MPTGPKHQKLTEIDDGSADAWGEDCRCMIGEDHYDGDESPASERISESDARDIWLSSGMDEDYDFR